MKKVTKKSLDELAKVMPVLSEKEQCSFIAGTGAAVSSSELVVQLISGVWNGGRVENFGYVGKDVSFSDTGFLYPDQDVPDVVFWKDSLWFLGYNAKGEYFTRFLDTYTENPELPSGELLSDVGPEYWTSDNTIDWTMKWEGGYNNDKDDKGGETNYGITSTFLKEYGQYIDNPPTSIKGMKSDEAKAIYQAKWDHDRFSEVEDPKVAQAIFDFSVNSGGCTIQVQKLLNTMGYNISEDGIMGSAMLNAINNCDPKQLFMRIKETRINYLNDLVQKDSTKEKYIEGWLEHVEHLTY